MARTPRTRPAKQHWLKRPLTMREFSAELEKTDRLAQFYERVETLVAARNMDHKDAMQEVARDFGYVNGLKLLEEAGKSIKKLPPPKPSPDKPKAAVQQAQQIDFDSVLEDRDGTYLEVLKTGPAARWAGIRKGSP